MAAQQLNGGFAVLARGAAGLVMASAVLLATGCGGGTESSSKPTPAPAKPSETPAGKPADKPAEKPSDKPAEKPADGEQKAGFVNINVGGTVFNLELALTPQRRFHGLSDRGVIPAGTGMLFVFPDNQVQPQNFVMRDCSAPIDIIYLDPKGRVLASYTMPPEPPRTEEEKVLSAPFPNAPKWAWNNEKYELRLKQYPSRYPSQFVIELPGEVLKTLPKPIKAGDLIEADWEGLKKLAR